MPRVPFAWITELRGWRADLTAMLAGAAAATALPPFHLVPVLLGAIPILLSLIQGARRPIVAARRGWWFGFGLHIVGLYWITEAILFEAARIWLASSSPPALPVTRSAAYGNSRHMPATS